MNKFYINLLTSFRLLQFLGPSFNPFPASPILVKLLNLNSREKKVKKVEKVEKMSTPAKSKKKKSKKED